MRYDHFMIWDLEFRILNIVYTYCVHSYQLMYDLGFGISDLEYSIPHFVHKDQLLNKVKKIPNSKFQIPD